MKSYELQPTYENLLNTYLNDTIARDMDVFSFIEILDSIDDSCSIALDGGWGSRKTFFVKQSKMILDAYNTFITSNYDADRKKLRTCGNNAIMVNLPNFKGTSTVFRTIS